MTKKSLEKHPCLCNVCLNARDDEIKRLRESFTQLVRECVGEEIEKARGNDYQNMGMGSLDYHEKCAVDAYIETLKQRLTEAFRERGIKV